MTNMQKLKRLNEVVKAEADELGLKSFGYGWFVAPHPSDSTAELDGEKHSIYIIALPYEAPRADSVQ